MLNFEEIFLNNVIEQEALMYVLEKKGIIKKAELLGEIKRKSDDAFREV